MEKEIPCMYSPTSNGPLMATCNYWQSCSKTYPIKMLSGLHYAIFVPVSFLNSEELFCARAIKLSYEMDELAMHLLHNFNYCQINIVMPVHTLTYSKNDDLRYCGRLRTSLLTPVLRKRVSLQDWKSASRFVMISHNFYQVLDTIPA